MTRYEMLLLLENGADPLEVTIQKWENIITGGRDEGRKNCALCEKYHPSSIVIEQDYDWNYCFPCPIFKKTNVPFCSDTPYEKLYNHSCGSIIKGIYKKDCCLEIAKEMLLFLEGLRTKEKRKIKKKK